MTASRRPKLRATITGALLVTAFLGLAGCSADSPAPESSANEPASQPTVPKPSNPEPLSEPQDDPEPKPEAEPKPEPKPAMLPSCEEILPISAAANIIGSPNVQFHEQKNESSWLLASDRLGPSAKSALSQTKEAITCTWFIPNSDGFLHFSVARLPDGVRDDFLAALRSSDYVESNHDGSPQFSYDDGQRGLGIGIMRFAFIGPFVFHTQDPRDAGPTEVIDGIRAANQGVDGFA